MKHMLRLFCWILLSFFSNICFAADEWPILLSPTDSIGHQTPQGEADASNLCSGGNLSPLGLLNPTYLAYDEVKARLFITDSGNNRIVIYEKGIDGHFTPLAVLGQKQAPAECRTGAALPRSDFQLLERFYSTPRGLSLSHTTSGSESKTFLFAADTAGRILVYDVSGEIRSGMAANFAFGPFMIPAALRSAEKDFVPSGVAVFQDRIYIIDNRNYRVVAYDVNTVLREKTHFQGSPVAIYGQADIAERIPAATNPTHVQNPLGLTVSADHVWIADGGNHRVLGYRHADLRPCPSHNAILCNAAPSLILGQPDYVTKTTGYLANQLSTPTALAIGTLLFQGTLKNVLFVAESDARIVAYDLANIRTHASAITQMGHLSFGVALNSDYQNAFERRGNQSYGLIPVTLDGKSVLLSSQYAFHRVMAFDVSQGMHPLADPDAKARFVLGQSDFKHLCENSPLTASDFSAPEDVRVYRGRFGNRLFVSDSRNRRIVAFSLTSTGNIDATHEPIILGQPDAASCYSWSSVEDRHTGRNGLFSPTNMYIHSFPSTDILFVTDGIRQRVVGFDLKNLQTGMEASLQIGRPFTRDQQQFDYEATTTGILLRNQTLLSPCGLSGDDAYLYVAECAGGRVTSWKWDDLLVAMTTDAANRQGPERPVIIPPLQATGVLGAPNLTSTSFAIPVGCSSPTAPTYRGESPNARTLCYPYHLANDDRYLYVGDNVWNRVLAFPKTALLSPDKNAVAVIGQPDFSGYLRFHGGNAYDGRGLNKPKGLQIKNNYLYVADEKDSRLLVFYVNNAAPQSYPEAFAVMGQPSSSVILSLTGVANRDLANSLIGPKSFDFFDGKIFIADASNNVKQFNLLDVEGTHDRLVSLRSASSEGVIVSGTVISPVCRGNSDPLSCLPATTTWSSTEASHQILSQTERSTKVIIPQPGKAQFRFTATSLGLNASKDVAVNVVQTPELNSEFRSFVGETVVIDAPAVIGNPEDVSYHWELVEGPSGLSFQDDQPMITFVPQTPGAIKFRLSISSSALAEDTIQIPFSAVIDPLPVADREAENKINVSDAAPKLPPPPVEESPDPEEKTPQPLSESISTASPASGGCSLILR
ncbi:MAG: hypothetical protein HY540_06640 [Deltaproteobacteria bacterium]|nr:hypothetical protein [Deltaproteobacteria bacterium]